MAAQLRCLGLVLAAFALLIASVPAQAAPDLLFLSRVQAEVARGADDVAAAMLEGVIKDPQTAPAERLDLLGELGRLQLARGRFADAGEAFHFQAELTARLQGATEPSLAGLYQAAAEAYRRAGDLLQAAELLMAAMDIDGRYLDCTDPQLGELHVRLSELYGELGRPADAARQRTLAADVDARCDALGERARDRAVVVEGRFAVMIDPPSGSGEPDSGDRVEAVDGFAPARTDSFATVKVYYATDRARTGSRRPNEFYGSERGTLEYGVLDVTVPRIHKPGAIESPSLVKLQWRENPERHIVIMRLAAMDAEAMFADMRDQLRGSASDEAFVFVHGYNVSFADAVKRTAQIAYDINFEGASILYSWPSRGSALAYLADSAAVRLSGRRLLRFLEEVAESSGARRIHLIAHSMGNRALTDALELMAARRTMAGRTDPIFDQIIFTAPDVDAGLFAEMIKTIRPLAKRLTLYASERDWALVASRELHGDAPRAGEAGKVILTAQEIDSIDMSVLGQDMLGHSYFASDVSALTDILWLFWRDSPPDRRCGMQARRTSSGRFWAFDPFRCDGLLALSTLTLIRSEGVSAPQMAEAMAAQLSAGAGQERAAAEWQAIRLLAAQLLSD